MITNERLKQLALGGGVIKLSMSHDGIFLIAGGESNEITAEQADRVMTAMQNGKIPTVETAS